MIADFHQGKEIQKQAFEQLLDLTENHQLEQIVSQPTRGKNILDLIFTNRTHLFGTCTTSKLAPQSDHDLVSLTLANPNYIYHTRDKSSEVKTPEIATYNFPKGNDDRVKAAFADRADKWREILQVKSESDMHTMADRMIQEFVEIAKEAEVPKYPGRPADIELGSKYHQNLVNQRKGLEEQMNHPDCTGKAYEQLLIKMESLNHKIQKNHEEERERREKKAIEDIKINSRAFFKFANKTRRAQVQVGPLKKGSKYYSGPKEMADILSQQYTSVFSIPKQQNTKRTAKLPQAPQMGDIVLSEEMFEWAMKEANPWAASGPDGVSAYYGESHWKLAKCPSPTSLLTSHPS